jgi:hypothetical protein
MAEREGLEGNKHRGKIKTTPERFNSTARSIDPNGRIPIAQKSSIRVNRKPNKPIGRSNDLTSGITKGKSSIKLKGRYERER